MTFKASAEQIQLLQPWLDQFFLFGEAVGYVNVGLVNNLSCIQMLVCPGRSSRMEYVQINGVIKVVSAF